MVNKMESFQIPHKSTKITRDFFARHADEVAQDLLGRVLVFERSSRRCPVYARIYEVAAYEGKADSMSEGAQYPPGLMSVSNKFGKNLLDIATLGVCKPSCITLVAAHIKDSRGRSEFYQGPGNVGEALDITKEYDSFPIDMFPLWIGGKPVDRSAVKKRDLTRDIPNYKGNFYFKD
ncbi:DNA-3-methyladenine glycosylase [Candidatus Pacearchaeota archaeon]|nr:DNA-3-methyladenine glycosylase [Candidatus Pacearchaeota archaeon]